MATINVSIKLPDTLTKTTEVVERQTGLSIEEALNNYLYNLVLQDYNYKREEAARKAAEKARQDFPVPPNILLPGQIPTNTPVAKVKKKKNKK